MHPLVFPLLTLLTALFAGVALRLYATPGVGAVLADAAPSNPGAHQSRFERFVLPLVRRLVPAYRWALPFVDRRKLRQLLASAGDPYALAVDDVVQLKVASVGLALPAAWYFGLIYHLGTASTVLLGVAALLPCFWVPDLWLTLKAERRQEAITLALPDFMDLLSVSMAAGIGFDVALHQIAAHMRGPLAEELERMLRTLRLGNPRRHTYRQLIWRNTSPPLRSLFGTLIQADVLGAPIADTLAWQAETLRQQRLHMARRRGGQASTKISLIMSTVLLFGLVGLILITMGLNLFYGRIDVITGR